MSRTDLHTLVCLVLVSIILSALAVVLAVVSIVLRAIDSLWPSSPSYLCVVADRPEPATVAPLCPESVVVTSGAPVEAEVYHYGDPASPATVHYAMMDGFPVVRTVMSAREPIVATPIRPEPAPVATQAVQVARSKAPAPKAVPTPVRKPKPSRGKPDASPALFVRRGKKYLPLEGDRNGEPVYRRAPGRRYVLA